MVHSNVWKFEKIWLSGTLIIIRKPKVWWTDRHEDPYIPPPDSRQTLFNQWKQSWQNLHSGFSLTHWKKIQKYRNKFHLDERLDCVVSYIHASSKTYSWSSSCSDYSPIITCDATDKRNPRCNELVMSYYKTSLFVLMDCFTTNQTRGCRGRMVVYNYLSNRCLLPLTLCKFKSRSERGVLDTILCNKVCQWLTEGQLFSPGTQVSSTNKTDRHM